MANGSQYGNNAYIAPQANLDDGFFDISVMKPFKTHQMPAIGLEMFLKKYNNSRYVDALKGSDVVIKRAEAGVFNIDGEPVMMDKDIHIKILPESLKVIVP